MSASSPFQDGCSACGLILLNSSRKRTTNQPTHIPIPTYIGTRKAHIHTHRHTHAHTHRHTLPQLPSARCNEWVKHPKPQTPNLIPRPQPSKASKPQTLNPRPLNPTPKPLGFKPKGSKPVSHGLTPSNSIRRWFSEPGGSLELLLKGLGLRL